MVDNRTYQQALEWTRERVPLDWATTQNNLGLALLRLGERESGTERLLQAAAAHRNAVMVWQESAVPEDWVPSAQQRVAELEALIARRTAKR